MSAGVIGVLVLIGAIIVLIRNKKGLRLSGTSAQAQAIAGGAGKMMEKAKGLKTPIITLIVIAAVILGGWFLWGLLENKPSYGNVIVAPVGQCSPVVTIDEGVCMFWERKSPSDQFLTDMRLKQTGKWIRQPTSGYPDIDQVCFRSATSTPAEVVITKRRYPCS